MNSSIRQIALIFLMLVVFSQRSSAEESPTQGLADADAIRRGGMVEHIAGMGVQDPLVLEAMRKVPRHEFVPETLRDFAYADRPLPIGERQTISQPYIVAFMSEALRLKPSDRVLEIGTGSGYQAAVLGELVKTVYSIEIIESLGERAKKLLGKLGYNNIKVKIGDGYQGWPEKAPFDAIIITAAPRKIPQPLIEQLAEGGRMILPLGDLSQELILIEKQAGSLHKKKLLPVRFVPMTGEVQGK